MPWLFFDPRPILATFDARSFAFSFLGVLFESIPFLLLGSLIAGVIEVFVPARWMTRLLPRAAVPAIFLSGLLGVIFPMCECGVVPVIRRLMKKGLPISSAVTYLLASPVVNPIVAVSTYAAFRGQQPGLMTSLRLSLSFLVAVLVGVIVQRLRPEQFLHPKVLETLPGRASRTGFRIGGLGGGAGSGAALAAAPFSGEATEAGSGGKAALAALEALETNLRPTFARRLLAALQRGTNDFLDVAVFVIIGAALASVFNTAVPQSLINPLATDPVAAVGSMMLLAFFIAVCSTSDAFIAATFHAFPFTAKLAFLVLGPVLDLKLIFLYSLVFQRRFVVMLGIGLFLVIGIICVRLSVWQF
jgi:uncharacterized membrane protein YraQ (UPF0718 family)